MFEIERVGPLYLAQRNRNTTIKEILLEAGAKKARQPSRAFYIFHPFEDFLNAYDKIKAKELLIGAHFILGLGGQNIERETQNLSKINLDGIKIHFFHANFSFFVSFLFLHL